MFNLKFINKAGTVVQETLLEVEVTVGRNADNAVSLADGSISRNHATFYVVDEGDHLRVMIRDEGSTNGCKVNGEKVYETSAEVRPGDSISIGRYTVELETVDQCQSWEGGEDDADATILFQTLPSVDSDVPAGRLKALHEFTVGLAAPDVETLVSRAGITVGRALDFDVVYVLLMIKNGFRIAGAWDKSGGCHLSPEMLSRTVVKECLQKKMAVLAAGGQTEDDEDFTAVLGSLKSVMCAPLLCADEVYGAVYVSSSSIEVEYKTEDLQFLNLMAGIMAAQIATIHKLQVAKSQTDKFETILAGLHDGVLIVDADQKILLANQTALEIFGLAKIDGMSFRSLLKQFHHNLTDDRLSASRKFQLLRKDAEKSMESGAAMCFSGTVADYCGDQPKGAKFIISLRDVSDAHRTVDIRARLHHRMARKIRESLQDPRQVKSLVGRLAEFTEIVLNSSLSAVKWEECCLDEFVDPAIAAERETVIRKDFQVEKKFSGGFFYVQGDATLLQKVCHDVVQNAIHYGKDGGTLTIDVQMRNSNVELSFVDDGPGLPAAVLEEQAGATPTLDGENGCAGAGLGLWMARGVLRSLGGDIRIASPAFDDGSGTCVTLIIQAADDESDVKSETVSIDLAWN